MKKHGSRLLTQKDMKDSPKKLSEFEKLVEVCRVARDLYYQENSALIKKDINSIGCSVFNQVGQVYDKSWGRKHVQEDGVLFSETEILVDSTSCTSREEMLKRSKTKRNNIGSVCCSVLDHGGQVYDKSWGKKPIQEDAAMFCKDEILDGLTHGNSCVEMFKGSKMERGESSSARFCKLKIKIRGDNHDYVEGKKVGKWNDYNGDFLNKKSDLVQGEVFSCVRKGKRSRKFFDSFEDDQDYDYCFEQKKKPRVRSICNARQKVVSVTSPLPVEFKNKIQEIRGTDIKLMIQKYLFSTDMDDNQNRFSIPMKQIREDFLTDEEENILDQRIKNNHVMPMVVPLIEPNLEKTQINFRKWAVNSSYVLSSPWNDIRDRNALKVNMEMQLWSFRVDGALNLALVKV
ncbi:uncharacterized protein LOC108195580 [Daucus carota subsp. sativus]|uniref:Uncharacterized protein n=2 Tax=Daucus carota subsp. sativus TaxID=79200 RepID=A0A161ZQJ8_DAUCS|nr:PREDICTED: uncharacterized protein LOC108195580 [Daucus carota subsp. sativus]